MGWGYFAAHGLAAHGFAAHGFDAAQGLAAHGLQGLTAFFAAQGFAAHGLAAHGFAAHGFAVQLATSVVGAGSGAAIAIGLASAMLAPIASAGIIACCVRRVDFLVMIVAPLRMLLFEWTLKRRRLDVGVTMDQIISEAASHGFTVV